MLFYNLISKIACAFGHDEDLEGLLTRIAGVKLGRAPTGQPDYQSSHHGDHSHGHGHGHSHGHDHRPARGHSSGGPRRVDLSGRPQRVQLGQSCHQQHHCDVPVALHNKGKPHLSHDQHYVDIDMSLTGTRARYAGTEYQWVLLIKDAYTREILSKVNLDLDSAISRCPSNFTVEVYRGDLYTECIIQVVAYRCRGYGDLYGAAWITMDSGLSWKHVM